MATPADTARNTAGFKGFLLACWYHLGMRTITIRYTDFRECPNCEGRGDDGAAWRPFPCRRCNGRGRLVTGVEVEDSVEGVLARSRYDFNSLGEVFLLDFDEAELEELEVIRPAEPWGRREP